jgi:hypothetical protein
MTGVVFNPNLHDPGENAKRRALLFLRHLSLWKELPTETEWFEVEINEVDLSQIRVFPRAQWRRLARGNYSIIEVVQGIRARQHSVNAHFLSKIASIGDQMHKEDPGFGAVILIGLDQSSPLTVLDGNHRLAAAMLASPCVLSKLSFICGLSPRMRECCWYNTSIRTLVRYGRNVLARAYRNPEPVLARMLQSADKEDSLHDAVEESAAPL